MGQPCSMAWSPPALKRRSWLVEQAGGYATTRFHHTRDATRAPVTDGLLGHHHAAGREDGLAITQAEAEAVIPPDRVLDYLGREAEAAAEIGARRHARHAATVRPRPPT